jgi:hypothetical protein
VKNSASGQRRSARRLDEDGAAAGGDGEAAADGASAEVRGAWTAAASCVADAESERWETSAKRAARRARAAGTAAASWFATADDWVWEWPDRAFVPGAGAGTWPGPWADR